MESVVAVGVRAEEEYEVVPVPVVVVLRVVAEETPQAHLSLLGWLQGRVPVVVVTRVEHWNTS